MPFDKMKFAVTAKDGKAPTKASKAKASLTGLLNAVGKAAKPLAILAIIAQMSAAVIYGQTSADHIRAAQAELALALQVADPPFVAVTDRMVKAKPAIQALGAAGTVFVDPTFGSRMTRVTDATMGGASWRVPSNAHLNAWSADSSKLIAVGNGGVQAFAFDATTMTATLLKTNIYSQIEPTFSRVDPDVLFTVGGPLVHTIRKYSFATGVTTDVFDIDTLGLGLVSPVTYIGGVVNSANDVLAVFFGGGGQDAHHFVWVRDSAGDHLLNTATRGYNLHAISIDQSGRFVLLYPANAKPFQVVVWDVQANTLTPITQAPFGHDALGFGEWVNMDVASGPWDAAQWSHRLLTALTTPTNLIAQVLLPKEIYMADHTTWNGGRLFSSTYRFISDVNAVIAPWRAWDDEIIELPLNGGEVKRYAHHRSIVQDDAKATGTYFWYQPIAIAAPNGKYIAFTSNWDRTLGNDIGSESNRKRQDVFVVEVK